MKNSLKNLIWSLFFLSNFFGIVFSIKCFRCSSTNPLKDPYQCNEFFDDSTLQPESCDDVYGARFCVKQTGRFEVLGIKCFQCYSAFNISCSDVLISDGSLQPQPCDHIYDAQFCVKMTGGLGTKRFCTSHDLGNYCNYVEQPGDVREYRSCYFTCSGDGCNSATRTEIKILFLTVITFAFHFIFYFFFF